MLMCLFIYLFVAPVGKMVLIYKNEIWSEILLLNKKYILFNLEATTMSNWEIFLMYLCIPCAIFSTLAPEGVFKNCLFLNNSDRKFS